MSIKNKKILVAGGNGFIGTNLCLRLAKDNDITILDNYSSSKEKELFWLDKNVTCIEFDICDYDTIDIKDFGPMVGEFDIIINLACMASPKRYLSDPVHTMDTCYIGTKSLLKLMTKNTIFLQASTSEVYGDSLNESQEEMDRGQVNCFGPRACYDEGKRIAETLCYEWIQRGYNVKIMRIFNTYGPYMDPEDGRVITNLLSQIIKNEPMTVYGDGTQTRSFQYIDDLLDGIELLIESQYNEIFNLGNPHEISINELIEIIKSEFNLYKDYPIEKHLLPKDDPTHRKPDITKAQLFLNYHPKYDIKYGIRKTKEWLELCKINSIT